MLCNSSKTDADLLFDLVTADKVVCSWGRGEDGQLGHGDAEDSLLPTLVMSLDGLEMSSITCGADHTTAYSESELEVYSWGWYSSSIFIIIFLWFLCYTSVFPGILEIYLI